MSDFELVAPGSTLEDETFVVACWKCVMKFDAACSPWCDCGTKGRSLQCPHCGSCFCAAPSRYKQTFWTDAPKTLRENRQRFGTSTSDADASLPETVPHPSQISARRPRVLIVDDEEPMRSLASCYVEEMGYEVTTAAGPREALQMMTSARPFNVVLTDALMPFMDGRELCRQLKAAHGDQLKVVLMTSLYTARQHRTEARHVFGVDEHLAKPLRFAELRDALQRVAPLSP